jgi:hypothetical protein
MWTVLDESDDEFLAEWAEAEADALAELRDNLSELPQRPVPEADLHGASTRLRTVLRGGQPVWPRDLLTACAGLGEAELPHDDAELWLEVAAGIVEPADELASDQASDAGLAPEDLSDDEEAMVALCALDHYDWLAVSTALARGGPGTPASADDLARFVGEYDPDEVDDQADAAAGMFLHVVGLWRVIGAVDDDDTLTQLGWWGIPEAVQRAWELQERE